MFRTRFDASAFDRAVDRLDSLFRRPTAFTAGPAQEWLAETEREQFRSEGAAGASGPWVRLSSLTERRKAVEGRGFRILDRTGAMREMLTHPGGLRALMEVTDDKVVFRLPRPAIFHQRGTRRMPQRKVVDPSDRQKKRLGERVKKEAAEQMRRAGVPVKTKA